MPEIRCCVQATSVLDLMIFRSKQLVSDRAMSLSISNSCYSVLFSIVLQFLVLVSQASPSSAQRVDAIPVSRIPSEVLRAPRGKTVASVDHLKLRKPERYLLDAGDTLAIFIEGVLGDVDSNPPVQLPAAGSDLPPAIGFPVPIRGNGTITLPFVGSLNVSGLTIVQVEALLKRQFLGGTQPILQPNNRILVSILQQRTYRVTVIRQDAVFQNQISAAQQLGGINQRSDQSSQGTVLQLPAYQNDVLNALLQTGGLPGVNANASIRVQRANSEPIRGSVAGRRSVPSNLSFGNREFPRSSSGNVARKHFVNRPSYASRSSNFYGTRANRVSRSTGTSYSLPTRIPTGARANIRSQDVTLNDGDVVYVDSRGSEVYYTGGLLGGGERLLPRDTDLDVLEAVNIARANDGRTPGRLPASDLIVLRRLSGNRQVAIRVDLNRAINDPSERILVAPGDTLLLRQKPSETLGNVGVNIFNTIGIRQLTR